MTRGIVWCQHCSEPHSLDDRVCPKTSKPLAREVNRVEAEAHPLIGQIFDGKYRIVRVIGRGGLGVVFEGENIQLRRPVAIKIVSDRSKDDAHERLRREAQIIASLHHPNVCDVYDVGFVPDLGPYLVTERLQGETIAERLRYDRRFAVGDTVQIVAQVLSALHAAHANRLVHRDIKPQNVFLVDRVGCAPVAKVLDFGLAKELTDGVALTQPGRAAGTLQYMAPEQLKAEPVTRATDIFAVGVLMYEMLAGRHPFLAKTSADLVTSILREPPPPLASSRPSVPRSLEDVVLRALDKDPARRFPDGYTMQRELFRSARPGALDEPRRG